jgi:hypothetical protein
VVKARPAEALRAIGSFLDWLSGFEGILGVDLRELVLTRSVRVTARAESTTVLTRFSEEKRMIRQTLEGLFGSSMTLCDVAVSAVEDEWKSALAAPEVVKILATPGTELVLPNTRRGGLVRSRIRRAGWRLCDVVTLRCPGYSNSSWQRYSPATLEVVDVALTEVSPLLTTGLYLPQCVGALLVEQERS